MIYSTPKWYRRPVFIIATLVALVGFFYVIPCLPRSSMSLAGEKIYICKAISQEQQERGLSNSYILPQKWGMLFGFEREDYYRFWMKDMRYPIDIVWLDQSYTILAIARNVQPETYPGYSFVSDRPALYVLETRPFLIQGDYPQAKTVKN